MTQNDLIVTIARLTVENYTFRDMVLENQKTIQEQQKQIKELEEKPPENPSL